MLYVEHEWSQKPIVTLTNEYWSYGTTWHGGNKEEFKGGMGNILKLQVRLKYKKPYAGMAGYRVKIDRKMDKDTWASVILDEFYESVDPQDNS